MSLLNYKNKNKKLVVAVSGGFDPLHRGHVRMFREAKKLGDELVVILNNDNWLEAKKGYAFMTQEERKEIIEALACVDRVVLTKHPKNPKDMSVCRELREIKPHIFANGGDRYQHNIPEVATCSAIGCKMVFNVGQGGKIQSSSWLLAKHKRRIELEEQVKKLLAKKVIIFDLDGTLTQSKSNLDGMMSSLLCDLLQKRKVAVIGGGNREQFQKQFLAYLRCTKTQLENLFILPTSGASLFKFQKNKWRKVYQHHLSRNEKAKILNAFQKSFKEIGYSKLKKTYGRIIEDRGSQITFSALGQKAPLSQKEKWNKEMNHIRHKLKEALDRYLPEFEIRLGGLTSVDITKKGLDKAFGVKEIMKALSVSKKDVVYIGDALYEGGNDAAVFRVGVDTIKISGPEEVKYILRTFLAHQKSS
jgi:hypothetical protein